MSVSNTIKKVTGLTGLAVSKNPHHTLSILYAKTLRALQRMPEDAAYRKYTEVIIKERAAAVNATKTAEELEAKIDCGQVEEVIIQAENELALARMFNITRPWESLSTPAPQGQWDWPPNRA